VRGAKYVRTKSTADAHTDQVASSARLLAPRAGKQETSMHISLSPSTPTTVPWYELALG